MNKKICIVIMGMLLVVGVALIPNLSKSVEQREKAEEQDNVITVQAQDEQKGEFIKGAFSYHVLKNGKGKKGADEVEITGLVKDIKKVKIPFEVTDSKGSKYKVAALADSAFAKNKTIESVYIPSGVRVIKKNVFVGCKNLKKISVAKENSNYKVKDNTLYTKSGKTLIAVIDTGVYYLIPKGVTKVKEGAFVYCKNLKRVIFPDTIEELGGVFESSCLSLEQVVFRGKKIATMVKGEKIATLKGHKKIKVIVPKGKKSEYSKKLKAIYELSKLNIVEDKNTNKKKVYLTFDDGPSENTDKILEILDKYNAKATFFVLGKKDKFSTKEYQKIVEKGHTIGVHSTSHQYKTVYASLDSLKKDYITTRDIVWKATGIKPTLYRFPGGSSNSYCAGKKIQKYMKYFNDTGVVYVDWNASNEDASGRYYTAAGLTQNAIRTVQRAGGTPVVLMHDAQAKRKTVDSLPGLIKKLQDMGYSCESLDEYVPPVQHRKVAK